MKKNLFIISCLIAFSLLCFSSFFIYSHRILLTKKSLSSFLSNYYQSSIIVEKYNVDHWFNRYTNVEYIAFNQEYPENKWIASKQIDWQAQDLYQPRIFLENSLLSPATCIQQANSLKEKYKPEIQKIFKDYEIKLYIMPVYCDKFEDLFHDTKFECCMKFYIALENAHFFSDESFKAELEQFKEFIEWGKETNNRKKIIVDYVLYSVDDLDMIQNDYFLMLKSYENTYYNATYDKYDLGFIDFKVSSILKP